MKIEFIYEDKTQVLNDIIKAELIDNIPSDFDKWNDDRRQQLDDAKTIRNCIYQKNTVDSTKWQSQIKLPDLYELAQTLKAHFWENIYQNPEGMFDVSGKTNEAEAFANSQKAMLVTAFEDMKIQFELDKAINDLVETGDCVLFVGWETKTKQIRRKKTVQEKILDGLTGLFSDVSKEKYVVENKIIFDGARVKAVSPESFVFDKSKKANWDSCPKIYQSWATIDDIKSNKVYQLDDETKNNLKNIAQKNDDNGDGQDVKGSKADLIEILEFWGDLKLDNDKILRNWLVTIAGRSEVIRFQPNPYIINPFICANLIEDPDTKRGISPLKIALVMNEISSDILNRQLDALALIMNPPYLAPKGCFTGKQEVSPGKIVEYEASLMPREPIPLKFDAALQGWEFINFFKGTIESSTGIFKNMVGDIETKGRAATELNFVMGGQSTRLNLAIDNINQRIIVPMVEGVADILANFKFGPETIATQIKGITQYIEIDDSVRQAEYKYRYGDRKAKLERKSKFKDLVEIIDKFAQNPQIYSDINWTECFKYALEQYGLDNPERFLLSQAEKVQKEISMLGDVNGQPPANTSTGNQQFNII